jgi:Acetyltransferase (GNAT) domain
MLLASAKSSDTPWSMATTSLPGPAGTAEAGYRHAHYAEAFSEFGRPVFLPQCRGWVLQRRVPGSHREDATSCYPIFACDRWEALFDDVHTLSSDLVSLTIVTDPFAPIGFDRMRRGFDHVMPFKEHFVVDLKQRASQPIPRHHRRYAEKALRALDVEFCGNPIEFLDDWVALFDLLVQKHRLHGMRAFSRDCFARQLTVPGIVMFRASHKGETVGLHLWFAQGDVGYAHLGATSAEGRALMASYGLYAAAIEWFTPRAQWLSLGGGAGTTEKPDDGLAFFKRGWATGSRPVYVCGRVLDAAAYADLAGRQGATPYFPEYRRGEVD